MSDLCLSEKELIEITHYRSARYQLKVLRELGIPAKLLRDNTVRVMRMDCLSRHAAPKNDAPQRKSAKR